MGGLWEAGIKSVKYHLKRALGRSQLTYEEFETVIIQVEGILNSSPLTPISNDFDNFEVLTPAHFLICRTINSILESIVINISDNRLSRWQRTTKVIQVVWKKWSTNYLNTLQKRGKWMIEKDNVMCGTMVIVKEDFTPVCNWLLGRVVEVYHGSDGKIHNLSSDGNRVRVWRSRGELLNPSFALQRHITPTAGVMVWGTIAYNTRSPLVLIRGTMTAQRYVHDIWKPYVLLVKQWLPGAIFQQDNAWPHTARVSQDCLRTVTTFPWSLVIVQLLPPSTQHGTINFNDSECYPFMHFYYMTRQRVYESLGLM
ncbi:integrase catalytic domain-containing protein [Trichonephila clavipes]|nr:integrase catalytic domain-containing protein [Trichonephila clavipes]